MGKAGIYTHDMIIYNIVMFRTQLTMKLYRITLNLNRAELRTDPCMIIR